MRADGRPQFNGYGNSIFFRKADLLYGFENVARTEEHNYEQTETQQYDPKSRRALRKFVFQEDARWKSDQQDEPGELTRSPL